MSPPRFDFEAQRDRMVRDQIAARGITDPRLLEAMRHVPRHLFVAPELYTLAYEDHPLPIQENQTISQPYMVAYMLQLLTLDGHEIVLEIGTGSGYQTALLCALCAQVLSVERFPSLAREADVRLHHLGIQNYEILVGDGSSGLPERAPFDAIIVSAAAPKLPQPLCDQLSEGGKMAIPLAGGWRHAYQQLALVERRGGGVRVHHCGAVMFVPLVGEEGYKSE